MYSKSVLFWWFSVNICLEKTALLCCNAQQVDHEEHNQENSRMKREAQIQEKSQPVTLLSRQGSSYSLARDVSFGHFDTCSYDDIPCLSKAHSDKHGLEAIMTLHQQLDDDQDGNIDYAESDDFLKEELKYQSGAEKRQKAFHRNNDMHISVKELWESWLKSEVHNWTVEQTSDWLSNNVHLPQYVPNFVLHKVTGANLPRMAVNNGNYLQALGIKDPIHRQKISLKAMDVVLFGPPKDGITWKDITLVLSAIVVLLGGWLAYQQNKKFKNHLIRMNKDMDSLQNSEKALEKLQKQLEEAKQAEESAKSEKQNLEKMLHDSKGDFATLTSSYSESDIMLYKEEIKALKAQLELAQVAFKSSCYLAPVSLQSWLQLTYELEQRSYDKKRAGAEKQLQQAREACEKLRKKRSSLIGAFVSTHGKAIDDVDRAIVEARSALNEVTHELQERSHRWRQIEQICGFPIIANSGLQALQNALYKNGGERANGLGGRMNSVDDLDMNDDAGSVCGLGSSCRWNEEDNTSESDLSRHDENYNDSKSNMATGSSGVHFQIGGTYPDESTSIHSTQYQPPQSFTPPAAPPSAPQPFIPARMLPKHLSQNPKSISQSNIIVNPIQSKPISRAFSQDTNLEDNSSGKSKSSNSEGSMETRMRATKSTDFTPMSRPIPEAPPSVELPKATSMEEDIYSTDSSVVEESTAGEVKTKKKRKLFPFSKRSSKKSDK